MRHRLPRALGSIILLGVTAPWFAPIADADTTSTLTMTAQVHARSVLRVSTRLLRFDVVDSSAPATAALEFTAASRTRSDGEVVLTIEPERWIEGPGGAADVDAAVAFTGEGPGTASGELAPSTPATAGRWIGSGLRTGRLSFTLRAGARGAYVLPVRLVLSAP